MAFPASPSNNQVHKEGNRSFVYDSTLGVWDQVKDSSFRLSSTPFSLPHSSSSGSEKGAMYYDSVNNAVRVFNGSTWVTQHSPAAAGGDSITSHSGYMVHTFTGSGTFTVGTSIPNVDVLVVAGGGGAGQSATSYAGSGGSGIVVIRYEI
jgi:hypothetical protein